jgi:hypothetical protein
VTADDDRRRCRILDDYERRTRGDGPPTKFDRQGRPITMGEWAELFEDKSYQVIVQTWTIGGAWVSTVWLGLDHGFGRDGPPIIFETMVWHDGNDTAQDRYSTEPEAIAGHERIVAQYGGRDPEQRDPPRLRLPEGLGDLLDDESEIDD